MQWLSTFDDPLETAGNGQANARQKLLGNAFRSLLMQMAMGWIVTPVHLNAIAKYALEKSKQIRSLRWFHALYREREASRVCEAS